MSEEYQLSEFLIQNEKNDDRDGDNFFNRERILILLDLYKSYKPKVGRGEIKSMKKMWEKLSIELSNRCRITIHPSKCENKFKVLERSYKKVADNNNRTGRGRKDFPYENEFNEIFGKKLNITPKILLSSSEIIVPARHVLAEIPSTSHVHQDVPVMESIPSTSKAHEQNEENDPPVISLPEKQEEPKRKRKRPTSSYTKRNDILTDIKNDLKTYYAEKLNMQKEKLQLEKKKLEDRKKRTKLLEKYFGADSSDS